MGGSEPSVPGKEPAWRAPRRGRPRSRRPSRSRVARRRLCIGIDLREGWERIRCRSSPRSRWHHLSRSRGAERCSRSSNGRARAAPRADFRCAGRSTPASYFAMSGCRTWSGRVRCWPPRRAPAGHSGEIEQSEVARSPRHLKLSSYRPDVAGSEGWLRANELAFVPGCLRERFSSSGWFSMVLSPWFERQSSMRPTRAKQRICRLVSAYFFRRLVADRRF